MEPMRSDFIKICIKLIIQFNLFNDCGEDNHKNISSIGVLWMMNKQKTKKLTF